MVYQENPAKGWLTYTKTTVVSNSKLRLETWKQQFFNLKQLGNNNMASNNILIREELAEEAEENSTASKGEGDKSKLK